LVIVTIMLAQSDPIKRWTLSESKYNQSHAAFDNNNIRCRVLLNNKIIATWQMDL